LIQHINCIIVPRKLQESRVLSTKLIDLDQAGKPEFLQQAILEGQSKAATRAFETCLQSLDNSLQDVTTHVFHRFLKQSEQSMITKDI